MKELRRKIEEKLDALEKGSLELSELEGLVSDSRELFERLLILKYKAYEKYGEPSLEENSIEIQDEEQTDVQSKTDTAASSDYEAEEEIEAEEQPSFDFAMFSEEETQEVDKTEEEQTIEEEQITAETLEETEAEETSAVEETTKIDLEKDLFKESHAEKVEAEDENSLNQKLKGEEEQSLRKKLQSSPISDIKQEISIAKKFEYITFMFDGKNEIYEAAIHELNNCTDGEEAKDKLNEYSTKYSWDLENKSIIKFVELVERRYL